MSVGSPKLLPDLLLLFGFDMFISIKEEYASRFNKVQTISIAFRSSSPLSLTRLLNT